MRNKIIEELNRKQRVINSARAAGIGQSIIDGLVRDLVVCIQFAETVTGEKIDLVIDGKNVSVMYRG